MIRCQRFGEPQAELLQARRDGRKRIVDLPVQLERRDDGVELIADRRGRWPALQRFVNEQAKITFADDGRDGRRILRERVAEKGQRDRARSSWRDLDAIAAPRLIRASSRWFAGAVSTQCRFLAWAPGGRGACGQR